jgi:hypothetical protein
MDFIADNPGLTLFHWSPATAYGLRFHDGVCHLEAGDGLTSREQIAIVYKMGAETVGLAYISVCDGMPPQTEASAMKLVKGARMVSFSCARECLRKL